MADNKPTAGKPDLTPLYIILLMVILAGVSNIRSCGPYGIGCTACVQPVPPSQGGGQPPAPNPADPNPRPGPDIVTNLKQYTVLAGSYKTKEEAYNLATELRSRNINNFILQQDGQWLVCVGKYVSAGRAERMARTLIERGVADPVVLPPRNKK